MTFFDVRRVFIYGIGYIISFILIVIVSWFTKIAKSKKILNKHLQVYSHLLRRCHNSRKIRLNGIIRGIQNAK